MSVEQRINEIIKKIREIESEVEEIENNRVSDIEKRSGGDRYLADYSGKRVEAIPSEVQKAIEFLGNDENLKDQVKVKKYFNEFSSKLSCLTLIFEIYYALRITNLMTLGNENYMDLIAWDRTMKGFYIPQDAFEDLIDKREYVELQAQLSRIRDGYDDLSNRWKGIIS